MGIKRLIALTLILTTTLSCTCYAKPKYSEESLRLAREAGLEYDTPLEEVLRRQEALKSGQANNSTPTAKKSLKTSQKGANDEFHIANGTGQDTVKVTDTDDLHIYSNDYADGYANAYYGAKNSWDEFHTSPYDIGANDGYGAGGFDEIHINENFRQNVWKPDHKVLRLGIDEFRLPSDF